jgi:2'-5' RNA ligase
VSDERERGKRLFLAINLSLASTKRVAEASARMQRAASERGYKISWVPPANLHVTVKFLGWTRPEAVPALRDVIRDGLTGRSSFEVEAAGTGAFPSTAAARVLWIGLRDPSGGLAQLARDVDGWTAGLGFASEERDFHPHVTLGRVREPAEVGELLGSAGSQSFGGSVIRDLILYESVTKSSGSEYMVVHRWPLNRAPGHTERQTRGVDPREQAEAVADEQEPDENGG